MIGGQLTRLTSSFPLYFVKKVGNCPASPFLRTYESYSAKEMYFYKCLQIQKAVVLVVL